MARTLYFPSYLLDYTNTRPYEIPCGRITLARPTNAQQIYSYIAQTERTSANKHKQHSTQISANKQLGRFRNIRCARLTLIKKNTFLETSKLPTRTRTPSEHYKH